MPVFVVSFSTAPLDDIGRNGNCCSTHLRGQSTQLLSGEPFRRDVSLLDEYVGQLKCAQRAVISHSISSVGVET
jgi:hypothetical protein